jgi:glutamine amidotransferase
LGNIKAFAHIYDRLNIPVRIANDPDDIACAQKIILPGVGAFDWAMTRLNESGLRKILDKRVLDDAVPVLGVCVGMQMMGNSTVRRENCLVSDGLMRKVVHFHSIRNVKRADASHGVERCCPPIEAECIFNGIENPRYYFLHSYCVVPRDSSMSVLAVARLRLYIRRSGSAGAHFRDSVPSREESRLGHPTPTKLCGALNMLRPRVSFPVS